MAAKFAGLWRAVLDGRALPPPTGGPTGDAELDAAIEEVARVASVTRAGLLWGLGDETRTIVAAQVRVAGLLAARGDSRAVETSFAITFAAYYSTPDEALGAAQAALGWLRKYPPLGAHA